MAALFCRSCKLFMRTALPFSPPNNVGIIKDRENETVIEKNSALRGSKLLILLKSPKSSFIFVETCSVQVKFEDKVTPKYLECPTPLTSDTETDITISGRNLRSLPISVDLVFYIFRCKLVSIQPQAIFDRSSLRAFLRSFMLE